MRPIDSGQNLMGLGGQGMSGMMGGGYGVEDIGQRRPELDGLGPRQPPGEQFEQFL